MAKTKKSTQTNLIDSVKKFGVYRSYDFNNRDRYLRHNLGLFCEELFHEKEVPTALRNLSKGLLEEGRVLIIPAREVLKDASQVKENTQALYLSITRAIPRFKQTSPASEQTPIKSEIKYSRGPPPSAYS